MGMAHIAHAGTDDMLDKLGCDWRRVSGTSLTISFERIPRDLERQQRMRGVTIVHGCNDELMLMCATLPRLTDRTLASCERLTDWGMGQMAASAAGTRLVSLELQDACRLTDAIWPHVADMTRLGSFSLSDRPRLSYAGVYRFVQLSCVSFRAAHVLRAAATPHLFVPPPSLSLRVTCTRAVSASDVSVRMLLSQSPAPYPCSDIVLEARAGHK